MLADFNFSYNSPIVSAAIHNGHEVSKEVLKNLAISEETRLIEEDPFTDRFTQFSSNTIISRISRFEVDLNRPREKCVYIEPEDAWGLKTRKETPSKLEISHCLEKYDEFYSLTKNHLTQLEEKFGKFFVYDIHSYNHHRKGSEAEFDDSMLNPEINIGTNTMPEKWFPLIDKIQNKLISFDYFGRSLEVRTNVKFPGGHFSRWIHNNFPDSACCIAIEFKKFWMNEWTGEIYEDKMNKLIQALNSTHTLIELELTKY